MIIGLLDASSVAVASSSALPCARRDMKLAVAGATSIMSAFLDRFICPILSSLLKSNRSV